MQVGDEAVAGDEFEDAVGSRRVPNEDCDMVMKGGITSGVVYPRAIYGLAVRYRLRNVGGASAGAIAAAAAAAAEYGRTSGGFDRLDALPDFLGANLAHLMQPSAATAPAYEAVLATLDRDLGLRAKFLAVAKIAVRTHWKVGAAALVLFGLPAWLGAAAIAGGSRWAIPAVALSLLLALGLALLVAVARLAGRALVHLRENGFGACDGHTNTKPGHLPLTDWLDETFNRLAFDDGAGDPAGRVLTFGHLWGPAATDAYVALPPDQRNPTPGPIVRERLINLEVMTTSLSMRRPFRIPFVDDHWLWCDQCLGKYFAEPIIEQMRTASPGGDVVALVSDPVVPERPEDAVGTEPFSTIAGDPRRVYPISAICPIHGGGVVRRLPDAPDFPVVVAVRMSLSFPGLFSSVPLLAVDRSRAEAKQVVEVVWMSDGGLSSNFPIHFFDSLAPTRPTFGIDLLPLHPDFPERTYLPQRLSGAPYKRIHPIGSFVAFAAAVKDSMQNWTDSAQGTLPGYRDRVVQVRLSKDEGGLNLRMPPDRIANLTQYGAEAAGKLLDEFRFDRHRETRFRVAVPELDDAISSVGRVWGAAPRDPAGAEGDLGAYATFLKHRLKSHRTAKQQWLDQTTAGEPITQFVDPVTGEVIRHAEEFATGQLDNLGRQVSRIEQLVALREQQLADEAVAVENGADPVTETLRPRPTLRLTPRT